MTTTILYLPLEATGPHEWKLHVFLNEDSSTFQIPQHIQQQARSVWPWDASSLIQSYQTQFSRFFPSCFDYDNNVGLILNIERAHEQLLKEIRYYRDKRLKQLDVEYLRALEQNQQSDLIRIAQIKTLLRNLPETIILPQTLEALQKFQPQIVVDQCLF